jgi:hypothetical protein
MTIVSGGNWQRKAPWVFLTLFVVGCSKSPPPMIPKRELPQPSANEVLGSVQFENAPVQIGIVQFFGEPDDPVRSAPILPDGTFRAVGIPPGDYRVALELRGFPVTDGKEGGVGPPNPPPDMPPHRPPPGPPNGGPPHGPGGPPHGPPGGGPPGPGGANGPPRMVMPMHSMTSEMKAKYDRIDAKYADPATSGLECKVQVGTTQLPEWQLSGVPAPEKPAPEKPDPKKPAPEKPMPDKPAPGKTTP